MALGDLFSDSNEKKGMQATLQGLGKGLKGATTRLTAGGNILKNQYGTALKYYQPYVKATAGAAGSYADALGLNGQAGYDRATAAFQTTPGYEFQLNQGLDAIDRRAASRGMLASGNNQIDTINYSQGVANQEYNSYLDRLNQQQQFGADIAGARAGIKTGLGTALSDIQAKKAGLFYDTRANQAKVRGSYYANKDQTGANIFGGITGGLSLGARLLGF